MDQVGPLALEQGQQGLRGEPANPRPARRGIVGDAELVGNGLAERRLRAPALGIAGQDQDLVAALAQAFTEHADVALRALRIAARELHRGEEDPHARPSARR